jgi:hypothetical protein
MSDVKLIDVGDILDVPSRDPARLTTSTRFPNLLSVVILGTNAWLLARFMLDSISYHNVQWNIIGSATTPGAGN